LRCGGRPVELGDVDLGWRDALYGREFVVELVSTIRAADSIENPAPVIQVIES
jgi:hypothetical protein